jgi:hypothetical protein
MSARTDTLLLPRAAALGARRAARRPAAVPV